MSSETYSRVPPTMAPSRFAPNAAVGSAVSRNRSAKIRFATKIGKQRTGGDQPRDQEPEEQETEQESRTRDADPPFDLDGEQDREQDADEDEGIHEPRGPEEQCELHDALRFQEEECGAHHEEVEIRDHRTERTAAYTHERRGREQHKSERDEVAGRDRRLMEVEERAVVDGRLYDFTVPWIPSLLAPEDGRIAARDEHAQSHIAAPTVADVQAGTGAEDLREGPREPIGQPALTVVVVDREGPVGFEMIGSGLEGFASEQVTLQPHRGLATEQRQRVRQGEDDEIVTVVTPLEERPAIIDEPMDPRIGVRSLRVETLTDLHQLRVDLHRIHAGSTLAQRNGYVVPVPRADDEHALRISGDSSVRDLVVGSCSRYRRLMGNTVRVDADDRASVRDP
jgi:hypothetical protein